MLFNVYLIIKFRINLIVFVKILLHLLRIFKIVFIIDW